MAITSLKSAGLATMPLTRSEYRAIASVTAICVLVVATVTFAASLSWHVTAVVSLLALPGSLLGGGLWILFGRLPRPTLEKRKLKQLRPRDVVVNVVVGSLIYIVMCYTIPVPSSRLVVAISILTIPALAKRMCGRGGAS